MTTHKEALTLALEALEEIHVGNMTPMAEANWNKAITAIKEALAQPEQEPYGYLKLNTGKFVNEVEGLNPMTDKRYLPLYTTQPQRKPLTDEQKLALCKQFPDHLTFNAIEAIEAAHGIKEKNT